MTEVTWNIKISNVSTIGQYMCMKKFHFERTEDVSGTSGVGVVAEGCLFTDTNEVVVHWVGKHSCINIYHSLEDVEFIHGHGGKTKIVFDD